MPCLPWPWWPGREEQFRGLGGLSYFYLKRRLQEWGQGYHSTPGSPMPMVASTLGPDEVDALASYLSFVR